MQHLQLEYKSRSDKFFHQTLFFLSITHITISIQNSDHLIMFPTAAKRCTTLREIIQKEKIHVITSINNQNISLSLNKKIKKKISEDKKPENQDVVESP